MTTPIDLQNGVSPFKNINPWKKCSYEEGNTTLRKEALASDFIWTEKPLELLGTITSIGFNDPGCATIKDHELTTDEVCSLLGFLLSFLPYTILCIVVFEFICSYSR